MGNEIDIFLEELKNKKNISANTECSYRRDLMALIAYLSDSGISNLNEVGLTHLNSYLLMMEVKGKKSSTISRCVASMHSFFDFLYHKKLIDSDPSYEIKAPKVEKKPPELLEIEEMKHLLEMPDLTTPKGLRDRAMLELICATGLRVSEAIALNIDDINMELCCVKYLTDGTEKLFTFGKEAARAIADYLKSGRKELVKLCNTNVLFPNCYGGTMSRQGFWKLIREYSDKAGFDKDITPHTLRNYYLTQNRIRHL